jgi:hypothetical protein
MYFNVFVIDTFVTNNHVNEPRHTNTLDIDYRVYHNNLSYCNTTNCYTNIVHRKNNTIFVITAI